MQIADNEAKQFYRQNSRHNMRMPDAARHSKSAIALNAAIHALSESDRQVIALKYFAGLSMKENALLTGLPPSRVKSRLYEARQKLGRLIRKDQLGERNETM